MIACTVRGSAGVSVANLPEPSYHHAFDGEAPQRQVYDERHAYYFRFGGHSYNASEFQNYLDYFARCLDAGDVARPNQVDGVESPRPSSRGGRRSRPRGRCGWPMCWRGTACSNG